MNVGWKRMYPSKGASSELRSPTDPADDNVGLERAKAA
jgi:hypothetical protein